MINRTDQLLCVTVDLQDLALADGSHFGSVVDQERMHQPKSHASSRDGQPHRAMSGERLFDFVRTSNGAPISCELAGNRNGIVVKLLERGQLYCLRGGFRTREIAVRWAKSERKAIETP